MICAHGHSMPDNVLACPMCAEARGQQAFRSLQVDFLRRAARGDFSYLLRVAKGVDRHVLMFTSYTRTFCGRELQVRPQIKYEDYNEETLSKVCAGCRIEIASLIQEAVP